MSKRKLKDVCIVEEGEEIESGEDTVENSSYDPYADFFSRNIDVPAAEQLKLPKKVRKINQHQFCSIGRVTEFIGVSNHKVPLSTLIGPSECNWVGKLRSNYKTILDSKIQDVEDLSSTDEMMNLIARYLDLYSVPSKNCHHRLVYTAHAINHVIKTRNDVLCNKKKLEQSKESDIENESLLEECRDQGFVRPVVLIMVPFRKDAFEIVEYLKKLVFGDNPKPTVAKRKRFEEEFGDNGYRMSSARQVTDDFKETREGNVDDCFKMGIAFSKKELRLYAPFEKSDIILCSPLGLRMILNGDAGDDSHIVSNMQIVILDGCDILMQQNWEHVLTTFSWLNKMPTKIEVDISRVRNCYLDEKGQYYSQTLIFSKYNHDLFTSLAMRNSLNHRGLLVHLPPAEGVLEKVDVPLCQELHRIHVDVAENAADARFNYFKGKVLHKLENHTLIYIPSYFDFVRVRNYLKKDVSSFVQCHEYAPDNKIARARDLFFHGEKKLLLLTERFHFYKRYHIRGIKNILFYQLPNDPQFYADMINMANPDGTRLKAICPYSQFDKLRLANVFGQKMANGILKSEKRIHAIVSE